MGAARCHPAVRSQFGQKANLGAQKASRNVDFENRAQAKVKFSEYLLGVVSEYAPHVREAATDLAMRKLAKADRAMRNPETLGNLLEDVLNGIAESWLACPHGTPMGEPCAKCPENGEGGSSP